MVICQLDEELRITFGGAVNLYLWSVPDQSL